MALYFVATVIIIFISTAFANDNGLGLTPPMGWNTWCTEGRCGRDFCNAQEVMAIADAMVANGMKDVGFQYINLDDCWADHRDKNGEIVADPDRFPQGLVPVVKYVNSKGFKFGLYTDGGLYTCSRGGRSHNIPGSYGHYEKDAATYASWGVEYVKMDWCNSKVNGTQLQPKVQYPEMSRALNKTGKKIFFNSCEWGVDKPWEWMGQYANSWRSGPDHHDNWINTAEIIEHNVGLSKYAGPGAWNDPDFLMTGGQGCSDSPDKRCPGMTDHEYRSEFGMWCLLAAPLLVVTDVRQLNDIQRELLLNTELIAVNQDKLGHQGDRIGFSNCSMHEKTACQIWAKNLTNSSVALGLFNSGSQPYDITFDFTMMPGWGNKYIQFYDLMAKKKISVFLHSFMAKQVPSHGIAMYKIWEYKEKIDNDLIEQ